MMKREIPLSGELLRNEKKGAEAPKFLLLLVVVVVQAGGKALPLLHPAVVGGAGIDATSVVVLPVGRSFRALLPGPVFSTAHSCSYPAVHLAAAVR